MVETSPDRSSECRAASEWIEGLTRKRRSTLTLMGGVRRIFVAESVIDCCAAGGDCLTVAEVSAGASSMHAMPHGNSVSLMRSTLGSRSARVRRIATMRFIALWR